MLEFDKVIEIAVAAGAEIRNIYQKENFSNLVSYKSDHSPITLADKLAHQLISERLTTLEEKIPILSEEGIDIPYSQRKTWKQFWLVDPLDGTKEFINRNGEFTVNIALIEDGKAKWGVIYAPALDWLYWGGHLMGSKSFKNNLESTIKVSSRSEDIIAVGSRSHANKSIQLEVNVARELTMGSSLKFCLLAEGKADLYLREQPTMEWDTAAGQAILEGAGGKMTTLQKDFFQYNKEKLLNPSFVATNGRINL